MILLVSKYLVPKGFGGITVFPFVILRAKTYVGDAVYINHEKIHIRQQLELLILPFFVWYGMEFLVKWIRYRNRVDAYKNISFESEAYKNEKDLDYLKKRPFWNFLKYI